MGTAMTKLKVTKNATAEKKEAENDAVAQRKRKDEGSLPNDAYCYWTDASNPYIPADLRMYENDSQEIVIRRRGPRQNTRNERALKWLREHPLGMEAIGQDEHSSKAKCIPAICRKMKLDGIDMAKGTLTNLLKGWDVRVGPDSTDRNMITWTEKPREK
jgi:hypothetical protein